MGRKAEVTRASVRDVRVEAASGPVAVIGLPSAEAEVAEAQTVVRLARDAKTVAETAARDLVAAETASRPVIVIGLQSAEAEVAEPALLVGGCCCCGGCNTSVESIFEQNLFHVCVGGRCCCCCCCCHSSDVGGVVGVVAHGCGCGAAVCTSGGGGGGDGGSGNTETVSVAVSAAVVSARGPEAACAGVSEKAIAVPAAAVAAQVEQKHSLTHWRPKYG